MPNQYELTTSLDRAIADLIESEDHNDLNSAGVTVSVLMFIGNGPLLCKGRPCYAKVRRTTLKERSMGMRDAIIEIDKSKWADLEDQHRTEILDHELWHLMPIRDGVQPDSPYKVDARGRPKLILREHDIDVGIFVRDVQKYGETSLLRTEMKQIVKKWSQLFLGL